MRWCALPFTSRWDIDEPTARQADYWSLGFTRDFSMPMILPLLRAGLLPYAFRKYRKYHIFTAAKSPPEAPPPGASRHLACRHHFRRVRADAAHAMRTFWWYRSYFFIAYFRAFSLRESTLTSPFYFRMIGAGEPGTLISADRYRKAPRHASKLFHHHSLWCFRIRYYRYGVGAHEHWDIFRRYWCFQDANFIVSI